MHSPSVLFASTPPARRVFVMGAYVPHGGTHMAYHLGRILGRDFKLAVTAVAVGDERADGGIFRYDTEFPTVSVDEMEAVIGHDDLLICNPSFSNRHFGLRLSCRKLMYIQGFNTFKMIDGFFDHYVTVSRFVHDFVYRTYGIDSPVIPPFIDVPPQGRAWQDRPEHSVTIYLKAADAEQQLLLNRLRTLVGLRAPDVERAIDWDSVVRPAEAPLDQDDFLSALGSRRYLLTLSVAEGFGLVPLEAMAQGVVVLGLDGFGGSHYMRPGENCATAPYPDLGMAADRLVEVMRSPALGQALSDAARLTAADYGYERFRRAWIAELSQAFSLRPLQAAPAADMDRPKSAKTPSPASAKARARGRVTASNSA